MDLSEIIHCTQRERETLTQQQLICTPMRGAWLGSGQFGVLATCVG